MSKTGMIGGFDSKNLVENSHTAVCTVFIRNSHERRETMALYRRGCFTRKKGYSTPVNNCKDTPLIVKSKNFWAIVQKFPSVWFAKNLVGDYQDMYSFIHTNR